MIARCEPAPVLRLGDEPGALALGRILADLEAARGRRPRIVFPGRGDAVLDTTLDGEDAAWILRDGPTGRDWLRALAAVAGEEEPASPPSGLSVTALREIAVLLASARRSAAHDLRYAFEALRRPPEEVRRDVRLRALREECARAVGAALRARPRFSWRTALVSFVSAETVEDVVAARWRDQLSRYVVLAANAGAVPGRVTWSFRSVPGIDGAGILRAALPPDAGRSGIAPTGEAGRGSLDSADFERLLSNLGFRKGIALIEN